MYKQAENSVDALVAHLREDNSPDFIIGFMSSVLTSVICRLPPEVTEREINIIDQMTKDMVDEKESRLRWK
jgi:hypothetical protein